MPISLKTKVQLASSLCDQALWADALVFARRWQGESPTDPKAYFYEAVALMGLEQFVAAETAYQRALAFDSQDFGSWRNLAILLFNSLNQPAEGAKCMAQAMLIDPGNQLGWSTLACMYSRLGHHAQALDCTERALALDPEMAEALLYRGRAGQALGKPEIVQAVCGALSRLPPEKFSARC